MSRKREKPSRDEWKALLSAPVDSLRPDFHPVVGYLFADGSVARYEVAENWTPDIRRAVATCFHSCARRMRGTWTDGKERPIAALLMVTNGANVIRWKQRVDFPKELSDAR